MFTFQITFKSEVCSPEPERQCGGNKIPLATASSIWKSFAKRARVCSLGKLDMLQDRDEVTLASPKADDFRREPSWLQSKAIDLSRGKSQCVLLLRLGCGVSSKGSCETMGEGSEGK